MRIEFNIKPEEAESAYEIFSWIAGKAVDAVKGTAQVVKNIVNGGIGDVPPEMLQRWQQGLNKRIPEPRVKSYAERMVPPANWTPPAPNLIPTLIKQGWLKESSKNLGHDSLTNRVTLLLFQKQDGSGWTIPKYNVKESLIASPE
ncbi:MAG: hypothetical protein K1X28_10205 [Parachlamydiales bacterium]|nr:hypothetical protein [Parachlamydiales bacterium]